MTLWLEHAHALRARLENARGRSGTLDATFETIERDSQLGGNILAGALSYRLFVFALPLSFFLVSGVGLLADALGVDVNVVGSSVGLAGAVTHQVESAAQDSSSNWWVALSSFFVCAYATRVLLRAVAIVHSLAWDRTAASVKVRSRAFGIFAAALAAQLALGAGVGAVNHQTAVGGVITLIVYVLALAGLWLVVSLQIPHSKARWTDLVPGSLLYAIGLTAVSLFNILILGALIETKSQTYGALGVAATLLLGFFFIGRVIVGAAVLNATLYERRSRSHNGQT